MNAIADFPALANSNHLKQIEIDYDPETLTLYWWMKPSPRPCFNTTFLKSPTISSGACSSTRDG